jgi:hypothetical protein
MKSAKSSRQPAMTTTSSGLLSAKINIGDPQERQKLRWQGQPSGRW